VSTETLTPAELARLLLDAEPYLELIERVAPHLPHLRPLLPMLSKWAEVEQDLAAARAAPAHLQGTFHKAVFTHLAQTHGGTEALWGALAHEMRQRRPQQPEPDKGRKVRIGVVAHSDEERALLRSQLEEGQRLMRANRCTPDELASLIRSRCGIDAHRKPLAAFRSGRYLRELDELGWPKHIGTARIGELITALELLAGEAHS